MTIIDHELDAANHLVGQTYDGAANMMSPKLGAATRIKQQCPMAAYNHCICHSSNSPTKGLCNDVQFMESWRAKIKDLTQFFKLSSKNEKILHHVKDEAQPSCL